MAPHTVEHKDNNYKYYYKKPTRLLWGEVTGNIFYRTKFRGKIFGGNNFGTNSEFRQFLWASFFPLNFEGMLCFNMSSILIWHVLNF